MSETCSKCGVEVDVERAERAERSRDTLVSQVMRLERKAHQLNVEKDAAEARAEKAEGLVRRLGEMLGDTATTMYAAGLGRGKSERVEERAATLRECARELRASAPDGLALSLAEAWEKEATAKPPRQGA